MPRKDSPTRDQRTDDPLTGFSAPVQSWFRSSFPAPTAVQSEAWRQIQAGAHSLVIAPTGSGKTLAAFLVAIDRLLRRDLEPRQRPGVRVLYISPLKALGVDVERNLRAPLRGIEIAAAQQDPDTTLPPVRIGVRSGDTPANERRRLLTHPPDILITTPKSLLLMLCSQVGDTLQEVDTVIIDEVHAVAGTKRGAHLAASLELLAARCTTDPQRIGLSATVQPPERVAAHLAGDRDVSIVAPASPKQWQLSCQAVVADFDDPGATPLADAGPDEVPDSAWPHLERRVRELVQGHRSTLVFVNSRRIAERVTQHLNDLAAPDPDDTSGSPQDSSHETAFARAHHGSMSKQVRLEVESALKAGTLRCVVATSSLELGIDMGAVDQVIQIGSPPSVASGLQRVGRAGHHVGAVSRGVLLPLHAGDVLESLVVTQRMRTGQIETMPALRNPLDVLAQLVVAACVRQPQDPSTLLALLRRSDPFRELSEAVFGSVVDMLCGRYPSEDFAELRPRLLRDPLTRTLRAAPGAQRLVTTSGGTIPDRGLFGVFLVAGDDGPRRVGELDEEMIYESRVGDVITLGTSSWRIEEITAQQVLVSPAPGAIGRLPFWKGDAMSRPVELGQALGAAVRRWATVDDAALADELPQADAWARENLRHHLARQREATGVLPHDRQIVVERFRDELGDWRLCVHSQLGNAVLAPWALLIEANAAQRWGFDVKATASNDGIVLRVPDSTDAPPGAELLWYDQDRIADDVAHAVAGSALFAARFRECAQRALLLPRRDPGRRSPLWQQRMRAAQLLEVAADHPDFPIVLETVRECLHDVFDLPALQQLHRDLAARRIQVHEVLTEQPSPMARSLLFGYVAEFLYEGDQPLAERRTAALSLDPGLLADLLGTGQAGDLLDPDAIAEIEAELQCLSPQRRATSPASLADLVRRLGPLARADVLARTDTSGADTDGADPDLALQWLEELLTERRLVQLGDQFVVAEDLGLVRDALGLPVPPGHGSPAPVADAAIRLVQRYARHHGPFTFEALAQHLPLPPTELRQIVDRLAGRGSDSEWVMGQFTVDGPPAYCDRKVLAMIQRRALARLRQQVEPVEGSHLARFLTEWQEITPRGPSTEPAEEFGPDRLYAVISQLAGAPLALSDLESEILPARLPDYQPGWLDQLLAEGAVVWNGVQGVGSSDGVVQLWPADSAHPPTPQEVTDPVAAELVDRLGGGGSWLLTELGLEGGGDQLRTGLWQAVWAGQVRSDTFAPLRELLGQRPSTRRPSATRTRRARRPSMRGPIRPVGPAVPGGRWSRVPPTDESTSPAARLAYQLERHGILTRGSTEAEIGPNFGEVYRALSDLELAGVCRRGYFVTGLGAAQFALPEAVDRLRSAAPTGTVILAASDPANPWGAALAWPEAQGGHRPSRRAGSLVVQVEGRCVAYMESGRRSLVTFDAELPPSEVLTALGAHLRSHRGPRRPTLERVDGLGVLTEPDWSKALTDAGWAMTPSGFRPPL